MKENATLLVLAIKIFDGLVIITSGILSFYALEPIKQFPVYSGLLPDNYLTLIVLGFIFSAWWFPTFKVYQSWRGSNLFSETHALLFGWSCSLLGVMAFIFFTKTAIEFSRHWFLLWSLSAFLLLVLIRVSLRTILRSLRIKGINLRHIVIVGEKKLSQQVTSKINASPWMGLKIKGYFSSPTSTDKVSKPYLGEIQEVLNYVEKNNIDQVWITLPLKDMEQIDELCKQLHSVVVEVKLVPDIAGLRLLNYSTTKLGDMPVINMSVSPMSHTNRLFKWIEDKLLSILILIIISPLLCIIALAVKLTSNGPIFYKQERVGSNGKAFQILKFRSMPMESDNQLIWGNAALKKKTRLGSFLRKTSLDELPQFINVVKGDMSIVGPRPERTIFVDKFKHEINSYMKKHLVHAGITGWAQINGWRGDTNLENRIEYDLFYIENWSLWFDIKIIWLTFYQGIFKLFRN